jgi:hypothetical protein
MRRARTATLLTVRAMPTAPIAGGTLIVGYAVAVASGSRALGGVVLLVGGIWCIQAWVRNQGAQAATVLAGVGLGALVTSHLIALAIGAWPAVVLAATAMAVTAWTRADSKLQ